MPTDLSTINNWNEFLTVPELLDEIRKYSTRNLYDENPFQTEGCKHIHPEYCDPFNEIDIDIMSSAPPEDEPFSANDYLKKKSIIEVFTKPELDWSIHYDEFETIPVMQDYNEVMFNDFWFIQKRRNHQTGLPAILFAKNLVYRLFKHSYIQNVGYLNKPAIYADHIMLCYMDHYEDTDDWVKPRYNRTAGPPMSAFFKYSEMWSDQVPTKKYWDCVCHIYRPNQNPVGTDRANHFGRQFFLDPQDELAFLTGGDT